MNLQWQSSVNLQWPILVNSPVNIPQNPRKPKILTSTWNHYSPTPISSTHFPPHQKDISVETRPCKGTLLNLIRIAGAAILEDTENWSPFSICSSWWRRRRTSGKMDNGMERGKEGSKNGKEGYLQILWARKLLYSLFIFGREMEEERGETGSA